MLLAHARGALRRKTEQLAASLDGDLSERHLFVMRHLSDSIEQMQRQLADIDAYLMRAMQPYAWAHGLLQTLPGIDRIAAALILIEIGDDMSRFGSPERLACWAALSPGNQFRGKLLDALKARGLPPPIVLPERWVVDCKRLDHGDAAVVYLGRYLYRGVIQERDILRMDDSGVTYRWRDSKTGALRQRTVEGAEFLRLVLQHVLRHVPSTGCAAPGATASCTPMPDGWRRC